MNKAKSKCRVPLRLPLITPLDLYLKITGYSGKLTLVKEFRREIDGPYFATPQKKNVFLRSVHNAWMQTVNLLYLFNDDILMSVYMTLHSEM